MGIYMGDKWGMNGDKWGMKKGAEKIGLKENVKYQPSLGVLVTL